MIKAEFKDANDHELAENFLVLMEAVRAEGYCLDVKKKPLDGSPGVCYANIWASCKLVKREGL